MKTTLIFSALLALSSCAAGPVYAQTPEGSLLPNAIGIHGISWHTAKRNGGVGEQWNNVNTGLYGRWNGEEYSTVVGVYQNSIRRTSFYVGRAYPVTPYLDVVVGAVTGYKVPVLPMLVPSLHYPIYNGLEVRVNLMPGWPASAVNLSFEQRF